MTTSSLYHLSIGSPLARLVEACQGRRVLVYHNITPPDFYRGTSPRVVYWLERGERELRRLAPLADLVIGNSTYNLEAPLEAGARRHAVVPRPSTSPALPPGRSRPAPRRSSSSSAVSPRTSARRSSSG